MWHSYFGNWEKIFAYSAARLYCLLANLARFFTVCLLIILALLEALKLSICLLASYSCRWLPPLQMKQPSQCRRATQETPRLLRKAKVHYRVYKSPLYIIYLRSTFSLAESSPIPAFLLHLFTFGTRESSSAYSCYLCLSCDPVLSGVVFNRRTHYSYCAPRISCSSN
jgi:hypothetical protein